MYGSYLYKHEGMVTEPDDVIVPDDAPNFTASNDIN